MNKVEAYELIPVPELLRGMLNPTLSINGSCILDCYSGSDDTEDGDITPKIQLPPKSPTRAGVSRRRARSTSTSSAQEGPVVRAGARTIYTAGRPPWYDSHGQLKEAFVIGRCSIFCRFCTCVTHMQIVLRSLLGGIIPVFIRFFLGHLNSRF